MLLHKDVEEILLSQEQIVEKCEELGKRISKDYEGKTPVFIALLKGAVPFFAEIIKHIECPMEIDFLDVSSYSGVNSTGKVVIKRDVTTDLTNRHVVFVEDIIDTGLTLSEVIKEFKKRDIASYEVVTLVDKPEGRTVNDVQPKYIGFNIPNKFVVGFGLDYNELYRNLPYIGVLKKEVYSK
jgi:hypoxanthine phosphoribosyltransferase